MKKVPLFHILFLTFFLISGFCVEAQTDKYTPITEFFTIYEKSPSKAIDHIFSKDDLSLLKELSGENLKSELNSLLATLGKYVEHYQLVDYVKGRKVEIVYCKVVHENGPVFIIFNMEEINKMWKVTNLDVEKDIEKLPIRPKELKVPPIIR